jgi:hypothetical protein
MKYVVCTFLVLLGIAAFLACGDSPQPILCRDIPAGGCLAGEGDGSACVDPSCTATYLCNLADGTWQFDQACPPHEGGAPDASTDAHPESGPATRDASIDAPPGSSGGPGCAPLEQPDCTLADALACPAGSCCNCDDLFVCQNGGWNHWGTCNAATGAITPDK